MSRFGEKVYGLYRQLFGIDVVGLGVFRILLGTILIADLVVRLADLRVFYTDSGVLPWSFLQSFVLPDRFSFLFDVGSIEAVLVHMAVALGFYVMLLVGFGGRIGTIGSFVMLLSLQNRNDAILQGGDDLLRVVVFWAMFLPLTSRLSLDRVLVARSGKKAKEVGGRLLSLSSFAYLTQLGLMYWFTAAAKTGPQWHEQASAVYYALSIDHFATKQAAWLLRLSWALPWLTRAVIWVEKFAIVLLFFPLFNRIIRPVTVVGLMVMHLSFGFFMELGLFSWIVVVALVPFLPGSWWKWVDDWFEKWLKNHKETRLVGAVKLPKMDKLAWWKWVRGGWSLVVAGIIAVSWIGVVWWNFLELDYGFSQLPRWMYRGMVAVRLDQNWAMFSPYPMIDDGWFVMVGTLVDGRAVDPFLDGAEVSFEKPELVSDTYPTYRWRKYLTNLWTKGYEPHRKYLAGYVCSEWNGAEENVRMERLQILYMREDTLPDYVEPKVVPVELINVACE